MTSSIHEVFYVLKCVVKNQHIVDNIAARTLSSCTKKLEKQKELEDKDKHLACVRMHSVHAYAGSNLSEVSAVNAAHYLLYDATFPSSQNFQALHLG